MQSTSSSSFSNSVGENNAADSTLPNFFRSLLNEIYWRYCQLAAVTVTSVFGEQLFFLLRSGA